MCGVGDNISCSIKEVLAAYKIADSSVSSIVHDQGSNMRRATDLLQIEKGWTEVNCSAHILQLCIADGFKNNTSIERAIGAACKLVGHFHHSTFRAGGSGRAARAIALPHFGFNCHMTSRDLDIFALQHNHYLY